MPIDANGREVRPGDLIRTYHYHDRRTRRKCYLYRLVVLVDDDLRVSAYGRHLYAVDVTGIWERGLDRAFKCALEAVGPFEIIDGLSRLSFGDLETWYERPKYRAG